ncbi:hypothetical protein EHQ23_09040 [Leptospira bourretii]|uniref:Uncharacterized protein n=1 Tax=Leptospira bourretii TaxID=2484962 RepID=A0A4R9IL04_9LEPT|nr:hypothetical protein [Leptospira bourretii]TGK84831.1 hypothetical protein EHQ23_09040 [Leptospira bourretii]TGK90598.1 hypothetical protein EHQ26_10640 [Leptospira bourretii]
MEKLNNKSIINHSEFLTTGEVLDRRWTYYGIKKFLRSQGKVNKQNCYSRSIVLKIENSEEYSNYFKKSKKRLLGRSKKYQNRKQICKLIKEYDQKYNFQNVFVDNRLPSEIISDYRNKSQILLRSRSHYCGGTLDEVILHLEDILGSNRVAEALYYALNAEIANYEAKLSDRYGRRERYRRKNLCISELLKLCNVEGFKYGIQKNLNNHRKAEVVIYFDLPGTAQLSWHINIQNLDIKSKIPVYKNKWDNLKNSVFTKIEQSILDQFPDIARTFDRSPPVIENKDYLF